MRVAIDSGVLKGGHAVRGIGFYTRNLVNSLMELGFSDFNLELVDFSENKKNLTDFDVLHYPYFDLFFMTLPIKKRVKTVVTIHDVIPLIYPKYYPSGIRGKISFLMQKYSLRSVQAIITDTETSKKDIVRFLDVDKDKIYPIHLAPNSHFVKIFNRARLTEVSRKYKLPKHFVLYVGDINYNKNILTLIKASKISGLPLVIVGKQASYLEKFEDDTKVLRGPRDWLRYLFVKPHPEISHYGDLRRAIRKGGVITTGFVSDDDLAAIYNLASVYCQPSYYEGFGLPVLEALACGTPVVASKTQALVEIVEGSAIFCDPHDPKDIAEKLLSAKRPVKHVRSYTWEKTARQTFEIYKKVFNE